MRGFEFFEELLCRTGSSFTRVFEALADALARVGTRGDVQQPLFSFRAVVSVKVNRSRPLAVLVEFSFHSIQVVRVYVGAPSTYSQFESRRLRPDPEKPAEEL